MAVQHLIGGDAQTPLAQHSTFLTVIQGRGGDLRAALTFQRPTLVGQGLCHRGLQRTAGDHAATVGEVLRREADITAGVAAVVGVDAGFDHRLIAQ
ncbi:hypothetical protein D3C81_1881850 [compost metagenome]